MSQQEVDALYQKFGPLLFSHYRRYLRDETKALEATRLSFGELLRQKLLCARDTVRFIRSETKRRASQLDDNAAIYMSLP